MCTLCQSTNPELPYDFHFPANPSTEYSLESTDGDNIETSLDGFFDDIGGSVWASSDEAGSDATTTDNEASTVDLAGGEEDGSALPTFTTDQIADYLTNGYWQDTGRAARSFDLDEDRTLTFDVSKLDATGAATARKALQAWSDVSGIIFEEVNDNDLVYDGITRTESGDAAGNFSTTAVMNVGDIFKGKIGSAYEEDYVKITLEAGKTYDVLLDDSGVSGAVSDTRLSVYDANGKKIAYNDDISGNDYHSRVSFTAQTDGVFYLVADASGSRTGNYSLKVAEGTADGPADIRFDDASSGAFASSLVYGSEIVYSNVNVSASWQGYGQYYLQTYIHEIGHALGLGHSGNYNGSASFSNNAHYANDSWQMTVMSYFSNAANPNVDASNVYVRGPMLADVAAIQDLYGGEADLRSGDTIYGNGATDNSFNFNDSRSFVIADGGGIDTIDLSHRSNGQYINLQPGKFGHLNGSYGNFAIAEGTIIENLITGSGADTAVGNAADNMISTGGGNDRIFAKDGNDVINAGGGSDEIDGGEGTDTLTFGATTMDGFSVIYDAAASQNGVLKLESPGGARDTVTAVELLQFNNAPVISVADVMARLKALYGEITSGSTKSYKIMLDQLLADEEPTNVDPNAKDDIATAGKDAAVKIDVLANDSDADGDALSVSNVDTSATKGKVTINSDGTLSYDAAGAFDELYEGQTATDSFTYTVSDGNGGTSTATATVTITGSGQPEPTNVDPNAKDDIATAGKDAAVKVDVLANDSDADGDALSVSSLNTSATKGKVTINSDGTVSYDAAGAFDTLYQGQTATDSFTYTVSDGNGGTSTATATVTITGSGLPPAETGPGMEVGQSDIHQTSGEYWQKVTFAETIEDAVVVMGPATFNGGHALTVRVRNITDDGFEFQVDEWEYLDGAHTTETVSWMAGSKGAHVMADGTHITFGETSSTSGSVNLDGFDGAPIVMATLTGDNEDMALAHRLDAVSADGFDFGVHHEENLRSSNATPDMEQLQWVAIDASSGSSLYNSGSLDVNHDMTTIGNMDATDAFFADMQTTNGGDTASLRYTDINGKYQVVVHEETSGDSEIYHAMEEVSWLTLDTGLYDLG